MSNIPPLIDMSLYINMSINMSINLGIFNHTQIVNDEPPPLTYMYEYKSYIMIGINMYKCKKCDKVLQTVTGILTHYYTHDRPTYNDINNETDNDIIQLKERGHSKNYSRTVNGRYSCNTCDKILTSRSGILEHVHKHMQNHIIKYKCNICLHKMNSKHGMFKHIQTHVPHIKIEDMHHYITNNDDTLRNTHHTIFKCKYCDYENKIQINMFQHFKTIHSINVDNKKLKEHIK
jgi:hypothetical protein